MLMIGIFITYLYCQLIRNGDGGKSCSSQQYIVLYHCMDQICDVIHDWDKTWEWPCHSGHMYCMMSLCLDETVFRHYQKSKMK